MTYAIKELFYTLQGEGYHTGQPAVFCRFAGCNLWSGQEKDRPSAQCSFCDTDFVGVDGVNGGHYPAQEVAQKAIQLWPQKNGGEPFIVCTGGEPLLQLDAPLIKAFQQVGFYVAVETNGTLPPPSGIDWLCVSPKAGAKLVVLQGNELKLVYPQEGLEPEELRGLAFDHFYLQPLDGPEHEKNTQLTLQYCLTHPSWKLSLQTQKILQIP